MTDAFDQATLADAVPVDETTRDKIKNIIRERRDLDPEIAQLQERLTALQKRKNEIDYEQLPALFAIEGITKLGLPAEGNRPPIVATLADYCHAVIKADWPPQRKEVAFARLDQLGLSDIVKNVISVTLNRGEDDEARRVAALLEEQDIAYERARSVPWGTLTAAVKELRDKGVDLSGEVLDEIGATIGKQVKLK